MSSNLTSANDRPAVSLGGPRFAAKVESAFGSKWGRKFLPLALWLLAIALIVPLGSHVSGFGVAPAELEVRKVALGSPRLVRVETVLSRPGDSVREGQTLVRLDGSEVDVELAVARAELQRLELEISSQAVSLSEESSETANRLSLEAERAALDASRLSAEDERDRSELAQIEEQIRREESLVKEGLARSDNLNSLKLRRAALAKKVDEFRSTVQQARTNAERTNRRLTEWRSSRGGTEIAPADAKLGPAKAAVEAQKQRVKELELVKGRLELKAPFDGRVGEILFQSLEVVPQGATVITVVDDKPTRAIAYVDQRWAQRIHLQDQVELRASDGSGAIVHGTVERLGASIVELPVRFRHFPSEPSFGREVYIDIDGPSGFPGQAFNASFRSGSR